MLSPSQIQAFHQDGYLVLPELFPSAQMDELKQAAGKIVDDFDANSTRSVFSTREQDKNRDDYFLSSGDKVRCFFEEDAFDAKGQLKQAKSLSINKIGHALHTLNPVFKRFSHGEEIAQIARELGLSEPLIHQSMYIFKQPKIGGVIRWHQDASYFYTDPLTVTTFWFAIEDATILNGCLQLQPGAHRSPLREQFIREENDNTYLQKLDDTPWPNDEQAIPVEVKKGSLVVFHGLLPHFSAPNLSDTSRHAYTLHITCATSLYSPQNWLQSPASKL
jgi:phytanoyl-CoA hydroxylase